MLFELPSYPLYTQRCNDALQFKCTLENYLLDLGVTKSFTLSTMRHNPDVNLIWFIDLFVFGLNHAICNMNLER